MGYTIIKNISSGLYYHKIKKFLRTVQVRLQRISQGLCSSPRCRDDGKENGNYRGYGDFIGAIYGQCRGYIGVMEKRMEITIMGYTGEYIGLYSIGFTVAKIWLKELVATKAQACT